MVEIEQSSIGIVVLAAGASSRMNQPKQLLEFEGKTLLRRAAETAVDSICTPKVVVLGANYEQTKKEVEDLPVSICLSENFRNGLSFSIKTGLQTALQINPDLSALIIMLADQPFVNSRAVEQLVAKFIETKKKIIASGYGEKSGVPAIFDKSVFPELDQLKGDQGAQIIFKKHRDTLENINLNISLFDIDTPDDFRKLTNFHSG